MEAFFRTYGLSLYKYARRFVDHEDAEDIVTDTLILFYTKHLERYSEQDMIKVLKTALFNNIIKVLTKKKKSLSYDEYSEFYDAAYTENPFTVDFDDRIIYIDGALQFLTPYQRLIVEAVYYLDMTKEEISEVLGVKIPTLNRTLERAKQFIKNYINSALGKTPQEAIDSFKKSKNTLKQTNFDASQYAIVNGRLEKVTN